MVVGGLNPGRYSVTVNGSPLNGEFVVRPGEGALSFEAPGGQVVITQTGSTVALTIAPQSPPSGIVGQVYSYAMQALGGVPPYRWSLISGNLPAGLTLDATGVIAGVPEREEAREFEVQVEDRSSPQEVQRARFVVSVTPPPPESLSIFLDAITTTMVGLRYGRPNLPPDQACNVTLALDQDFSAIVDDFFDYGGPPFRDLTFGWDLPLVPATQYYLRARCGEDLTLAQFETLEEDGSAPAAPPQNG